MKGKMYFLTMLITLIMVVLAGALDVAVAEPESAPKLPALTDDNYRPGKTDPISNPARKEILAQKRLLVLTPFEDHFCSNLNEPTSDKLEDWHSLYSYCSSSGQLPAILSKSSASAMAAGRILEMSHDDTFSVYYGKNNHGYSVVVFMNEYSNLFQELGPYRDDKDCPGTHYTVDIAVGDIDGEKDQNGETHEEIVVAYKGYDNSCIPWVYVAALKGTRNPDKKILSLDVLSHVKLDPAIPYSDGFLSLTTGDYNNDGTNEIAVCWPIKNDKKEKQYFQTSVLSYVADKKTLQVNASNSDHYDFHYNLVDLASGDFDGDGNDEIAGVFGSAGGTKYVDMTVNVYDVDLKNQKISMAAQYFKKGWGCLNGASITSGFFKYLPEDGYSKARRQIAVVSANKIISGGESVVDIFDVTDQPTPGTDFKLGLIRGKSENLHYYGASCIPGAWKPEIVAGRFLTLNYEGDFDEPTIRDQIATSWTTAPPIGLSGPGDMWFCALYVNNDLTMRFPQKRFRCFHPGNCKDSRTQYLSSAPIAGQAYVSYYLGNPIHITIPNILKAMRIIQEPPKHIDYLPDENGEWQIMNVSKREDFYASFDQSTSEVMTTETKRETAWDIGGSESVTAEETFKAGIPYIGEAEVSASQTLETSYDFKSVTEKDNKNYSGVTFSSSFSTNVDDGIQFKTFLMDIWRYRIYGMITKDDKNAFYEVHLPGNMESGTVAGTGMSDYYQPIHENGNLFSYGVYVNDKAPELPDDLGSFSADGDSFTRVMNENSFWEYGANESNSSLKWENGETSSSTITQESTYSESMDFKMGFSGDIGGVDIDVSYNNSNSWSKTAISESETTRDSAVAIEVPSAGSGPHDAYRFKPIVYSTKDGALKLAHTVNISKDVTAFWYDYYSDQPDLSLNLPLKFHWHDSDDEQKLGDWSMWDTRQERSRMRGVFLSKNDPEKNETDIQYMGRCPTAGDTLYIQAYVYNYSLVNMDDPFVVRFSYAPAANMADSEPDLTTIGDVIMPPLNAWERKTASIKWDIAGDLGGDDPTKGKPYFIYVTLDPDNDVKNEIHELFVEDQTPLPKKTCPTGKDKNGNETYSKPCGIFCASNNQGYWPWDNSFMIFCPSKGAEPLAPLELKFKSETLELQNTSRSEKYGDEVFTHVEYLLKVIITANRGDKDFRDVFFYDNGKLFSMKRSFGLNPGENDFYCRWKPQEPGVHTLKVMITEAEKDPVPGDNSVLLDVEVLPFDRPIHR